ncbi:MAG: hypothetical protein JO148_07350 [Acidimicrobiia bacterium]|nr:hypothetical protein [Acidimicrobiia bacterium]
MQARRSPVIVGIVLGLLVGAGAVAAIAATSSGSGSSASPPKVIIAPQVAVSPTTATTTGGPLSEPQNLPQLTGDAQGYRLGSQPAPGAIDRLAAAFDMHAAVQTDGSGWVVRDGDKLLRVQRTTGLPWFFSRQNAQCNLVPESPPPSTLPTVPPSGPVACPDLVASHDDALSFGMQTLGRAGLGVSRPVIVDEPGGWYIEASPLVGSTPTAGIPWTITVGPGLSPSAASGFLAGPVRADTYRLVGIGQGLVRARQVAHGGTITGVRLGLMLGHVGTAPYLVPAYLFELDGGGGPPPILPVPAIEDRYLS